MKALNADEAESGAEWIVEGVNSLVCGGRERHVRGVFCVTEAEAAAIRAVFLREGELMAAIELRRLFSSIPDNAQARAHARMIAGWQPLPAHPALGTVVPLRTRRRVE